MFLVICHYKPDADLTRFKYREEHLLYMISALPHTFCGGPMLADAGQRSSGAVYILDLPDRAAVESFVANEPFFRNGLFESVAIRRWRHMTSEALHEELRLDRERQRQETTSDSTTIAPRDH